MLCGNSDCQAAVPMKNKQDEVCCILINIILYEKKNLFTQINFKVLDSISCSKCLEKISDDKIKTFYDVTDFTEFQLSRMKDIGCILYR